MVTGRWIHGVNILSLSQVVRTPIYLAEREEKGAKDKEMVWGDKKKGLGMGV